MASEQQPMSEDGGAGRDFKVEPPLPDGDTRHQAAAEPPGDALADQSAASNAASQAEGEGAVEGVFKTPWWVTEAIVKNQTDAKWWLNCSVVERWRKQCKDLIDDLDLRAKDAEKVGVPLIKVELMNVRTLATYSCDADGYAIAGTIIVNQQRLPELEPFMEAALMLTLLVRARHHQLGGDGRLDREGRELMKAKGLIITEGGGLTISEDGPFRRFLEKQRIDVPVASVLPRPKRAGKTTLRVWSCTCQRCRVGTKAFFATCPHCGEPFRPGDFVGRRFVKTDIPAVPA